MRPTVGLFGVLARVNTVRAEKLCMHGVTYTSHSSTRGYRLPDLNVTFVLKRLIEVFYQFI